MQFFVKESARKYRPATPEETISAAASLLRDDMKGKTIMDSPQRVKDFLRLQIGALEREVFGAVFLDSQHRVIDWVELFAGTLSQTSVYPREVVKTALRLNAAAVVLAHNHPSGMAEPSRADEHLTKALKSALDIVDVRVLDHIVVGAVDSVSFAERGML